MPSIGIIVNAVLWSFFLLLFALAVLLVCVYRHRALRVRRRQRQLINCPPAEAFTPNVLLPPVVDAVAVFPTDDEARNHIEECNVPLTRLPTEVGILDKDPDENPCIVNGYERNHREPFVDHSSSVQGDGNHLPSTRATEAMMYGLPIDTRNY
ncbi:uncharacterized protein TM35_000262040, partial [Trypanosoma theileri]